MRRRDYDRLSIGSPIPAILPQDEDTDNRELGVTSPFPAIKVSSCGELRSTLTTASEEELLTPSSAESAGLLGLSTPLYRRSTDGRYLQVTSQLFPFIPSALRPVSPGLPLCSSTRGGLLRHTNLSVQRPILLSSLYSTVLSDTVALFCRNEVQCLRYCSVDVGVYVVVDIVVAAFFTVSLHCSHVALRRL